VVRHGKGEKIKIYRFGASHRNTGATPGTGSRSPKVKIADVKLKD